MDGYTAVVDSIVVLVLVALALRCVGSPIFGRKQQPPMDTTGGIPHNGLHRCHFAGTACFDYIASHVFAAVLADLSGGSLTFWIVVVLVLGEVEHWWYGIPTSTQRWLFGYQ